jgi:hypothetical protein
MSLIFAHDMWQLWMDGLDIMWFVYSIKKSIVACLSHASCIDDTVGIWMNMYILILISSTNAWDLFKMTNQILVACEVYD